MNNFNLMDLLNFLRRPQNSKSLLLLAFTLFVSIYVSYMFIVPKIQSVKSLKTEITASEQKLADLKTKRDTNLAKMKASQTKLENIPVKVYRSSALGLPVESASVEFVSTVIKMIEQAGNSIVDISYKVDSAGAEQKDLLPANVSVVELTMTLNGTFADLQEFIFNLYDYNYLGSVKMLKSTPLRENKNILETDIVVWLYIASN